MICIPIGSPFKSTPHGIDIPGSPARLSDIVYISPRYILIGSASDEPSFGAVVGATYPEMGKTLRKVMPKAYILVPGYGAQGGKAEDLAAFFNPDGLGAIVNSSRGIIAAYKKDEYAKFGDKNFGEASRQAALDMIADINGALGK